MKRILAAAAASLCLAGCAGLDPIARTAADIGVDPGALDGRQIAALCTVAKIAQGLKAVELTAEERSLIIPAVTAAADSFAGEAGAPGAALYEDEVYEASARLADAFGGGLGRRTANLLAGLPGAANIVREAVAYAGGARAVERGCARLVQEAQGEDGLEAVTAILRAEIAADLDAL